MVHYPQNGHHARNTAGYGAIRHFVAFLMHYFDIFCCFGLFENTQISGGEKQNRTADLLNAMQKVVLALASSWFPLVALKVVVSQRFFGILGQIG